MSMTDTDRKAYFDFLDELRESGETNMLGAGICLQGTFVELGRESAKAVLTEWMDTFAERHP